VLPEFGLWLVVNELAQRLASGTDDGLAVGQQQQVEVETEQPAIGLAQSLLGLLGVVHQLIGHEPERVAGAPAATRSAQASAPCAGM
jgi:hypothetical protein